MIFVLSSDMLNLVQQVDKPSQISFERKDFDFFRIPFGLSFIVSILSFIVSIFMEDLSLSYSFFMNIINLISSLFLLGFILHSNFKNFGFMRHITALCIITIFISIGIFTNINIMSRQNNKIYIEKIPFLNIILEKARVHLNVLNIMSNLIIYTTYNYFYINFDDSKVQKNIKDKFYEIIEQSSIINKNFKEIPSLNVDGLNFVSPNSIKNKINKIKQKSSLDKKTKNNITQLESLLKSDQNLTNTLILQTIYSLDNSLLINNFEGNITQDIQKIFFEQNPDNLQFKEWFSKIDKELDNSNKLKNEVEDFVKIYSPYLSTQFPAFYDLSHSLIRSEKIQQIESNFNSIQSMSTDEINSFSFNNNKLLTYDDRSGVIELLKHKIFHIEENINNNIKEFENDKYKISKKYSYTLEEDNLQCELYDFLLKDTNQGLSLLKCSKVNQNGVVLHSLKIFSVENDFSVDLYFLEINNQNKYAILFDKNKTVIFNKENSFLHDKIRFYLKKKDKNFQPIFPGPFLGLEDIKIYPDSLLQNEFEVKNNGTSVTIRKKDLDLKIVVLKENLLTLKVECFKNSKLMDSKSVEVDYVYDKDWYKLSENQKNQFTKNYFILNKENIEYLINLPEKVFSESLGNDEYEFNMPLLNLRFKNNKLNNIMSIKDSNRQLIFADNIMNNDRLIKQNAIDSHKKVLNYIIVSDLNRKYFFAIFEKKSQNNYQWKSFITRDDESNRFYILNNNSSEDSKYLTLATYSGSYFQKPLDIKYLLNQDNKIVLDKTRTESEFLTMKNSSIVTINNQNKYSNVSLYEKSEDWKKNESILKDIFGNYINFQNSKSQFEEFLKQIITNKKLPNIYKDDNKIKFFANSENGGKRLITLSLFGDNSSFLEVQTDNNYKIITDIKMSFLYIKNIDNKPLGLLIPQGESSYEFFDFKENSYALSHNGQKNIFKYNKDNSELEKSTSTKDEQFKFQFPEITINIPGLNNTNNLVTINLWNILNKKYNALDPKKTSILESQIPNFKLQLLNNEIFRIFLYNMLQQKKEEISCGSIVLKNNQLKFIGSLYDINLDSIIDKIKTHTGNKELFIDKYKVGIHKYQNIEYFILVIKDSDVKNFHMLIFDKNSENQVKFNSAINLLNDRWYIMLQREDNSSYFWIEKINNKTGGGSILSNIITDSQKIKIEKNKEIQLIQAVSEEDLKSFIIKEINLNLKNQRIVFLDSQVLKFDI